MRVLTVAALGAALLLPPVVVAQTTPLTQPTPPGVPTAGFEMPGVPVGKPSILQPVGTPVGTRLPTVGTQLQQAVDPKKPTSPFNGVWPTVDEDLVIAPYPGMKKASADFWDRLAERWAALLAPPPPPPTKWIPGTTRRARERRERQQELLERRMRD